MQSTKSGDSDTGNDLETVSLERVLRAKWGEVLALLTGRLRDIQLAEDVLQEATMAALQHWSRASVPENPAGWLYRVALNRALDAKRHQQMIEGKQAQIVIHTDIQQSALEPEEMPDIPDERLRMIFTCCHPSLSRSAQLALTLRTLCGLTTAEIARAFLVPEATMAQRLVRTKRKIRTAGIPYEVPGKESFAQRLDAVLGVVYLIFNEGYSASSGENPIRSELCLEALYLSQSLVELIPDNPEVFGLLALLNFHDARRPARLNADGELVMLQHQDRSLWDKQKIELGFELLTRASRLQLEGPYQLQAAISAVHSQAHSAEKTNWASINQLYLRLYGVTPTPVVALNCAVSMSYSEGPGIALEWLQSRGAADQLEHYQPYHATLADLYRRLERRDKAKAHYEAAIALSTNASEKGYLQQQLGEMIGVSPKV